MKIASVLVLYASTTAFAEDIPSEVTADQAIALYRAHSPRLVAERAAVGVAAADVITAGLYPNPTLGLASTSTVHGTDTIGGTQAVVSLEIPLLLGHQRRRRERAAEAAVAATRAEVAATQTAAEHEVRGLVVALQAAQQKLATLRAAVDDVQIVRGIVEGRTRAGAASPYELDRIDLAVATMTSELAEAGTEAALASRALGKAVGLSGWQPRAAGELTPSPHEATALSADHPALVAVRGERARAQAEEDRARADGLPVPSLALQSFATTSPSGMAVTGGISVPLPLFDRNQGAVARAKAEAARAGFELAARERELRTDLDTAWADLGSRRDALAAFEQGALARLAHLRAMAETAYRSGQGGIVELLDAVEAITSARLRYVELLRAVVDAELAVRAASTGD